MARLTNHYKKLCRIARFMVGRRPRGSIEGSDLANTVIAKMLSRPLPSRSTHLIQVFRQNAKQQLADRARHRLADKRDVRRVDRTVDVDSIVQDNSWPAEELVSKADVEEALQALESAQPYASLALSLQSEGLTIPEIVETMQRRLPEGSWTTDTVKKLLQKAREFLRRQIERIRRKGER